MEGLQSQICRRTVTDITVNDQDKLNLTMLSFQVRLNAFEKSKPSRRTKKRYSGTETMRG